MLNMEEKNKDFITVFIDKKAKNAYFIRGI